MGAYVDFDRRLDDEVVAELPGGGAVPDSSYQATGYKFPLMNRDDACKTMLRAFDKLEELRLEAAARSVADRERIRHDEGEYYKGWLPPVPYCSGMPGMGKTRLLWDATTHLMRQQLAAGRSEAVAAKAVVKSIAWDDEQAVQRGLKAASTAADTARRVALVTALWRAGNEHRTFWLDCSSTHRDLASPMEGNRPTYIAAVLLASWAQRTYARRADAPRSGDCARELYAALLRRCRFGTTVIGNALSIICGGERTGKAVTITIDGAHRIDNLQFLMTEL